MPRDAQRVSTALTEPRISMNGRYWMNQDFF
jgi:hypothetical protein